MARAAQRAAGVLFAVCGLGLLSFGVATWAGAVAPVVTKLTVAGLAGAAALAHAAPAIASVNDVADGRLSVVRVAVTAADFAPTECAHLALSGVVTAEPGSDGARIRGTRGADLILGSAGDDVLDGLAGDDCIVGGPGNAELDGGPGDDTCLPGGETGDRTARCES